MSQAGLIDIEASHPQIPTSFTTDSGTAIPLGNVLEILGSSVSHTGVPVETNGSGNTVDIFVQVGASNASSDASKAGLVSFDSTAFVVDVNGFVTLTGGSGPAIDTVISDDGDITPTAAGAITLQGDTVATGTHAKPVFVDAAGGSSTGIIDVQVGKARTGAPGNKLDAGLVSLDDTVFSVDADGYVTLASGPGPLVDTFTTDLSSPVVPNASGAVAVTGTSIFSSGSVANTITLNVEATEHTFLVGAGADTNVTELGPLLDGELIIGVTAGAPVAATLTDGTGITITEGAGSITIAVDASVVGKTLTGDVGVAIAPTAGNWNIFGGPGITTSSAGSTVTINSVIYTDQTATTLTSDSGTFATAAGAYVLPASPAQGEIIEIVCITTGIVVTANTGQIIQMNQTSTAAAGTATNSASGDTMVLRYRTATTTWHCISNEGLWDLV